jgi:hypothetical protein
MMIEAQDKKRGQVLGTFRLPAARWEAFGEQATAADSDRSKVLNALVAWYDREPGARLPQRPATNP